MTATNAKPERKRKELLDTWEFPALPSAPQQMLPERKLLCTILNLNVQAAIRGDERSTHWLNCLDGVFVDICELLFDSSIPDRIRSAVNARQIAKQERFRGNQYRPGPNAHPASLKPVKPTSAATLSARPAIAQPSVTLSPVSPVTAPWKPIIPAMPVTVDVLAGGMWIVQSGIPLPKRIGRKRNANANV
jgi:hypothetical protein